MPPGIGYNQPRPMLFGTAPNAVDQFARAMPKVDRANQQLAGMDGLGGALRDFAMAHPKGPMDASVKTLDAPDKLTPPAVGTGGAGSHLFTGFDFQQDAANRDTSKSAKYAFSNLAGDAAMRDGRWRNKDTADDWFMEFVAPGLQAQGFEVRDVQGDKAYVVGREDAGWVDFVQDAGGDNPLLAWQPETSEAGLIGGGGGGPVGMGDGSDLMALLMGGGVPDSSGLMQQIQAELQRLLGGQPEAAPMVDPLMELI